MGIFPQGIEYMQSRQMYALDCVMISLARPVSNVFLEPRVARTLSKELNDGGGLYYAHIAETAIGELVLPKFRSMHPEDESTEANTEGIVTPFLASEENCTTSVPADDELVDFDKSKHPRLPESTIVKEMRDESHCDELPQLILVPYFLSLNGLRATSKRFQEHQKRLVSPVDPGLWRAYKAIKRNPLIRDGLGGVEQLSWHGTDSRQSDVIVPTMRTAVRYYSEEINLMNDLRVRGAVASLIVRGGVRSFLRSRSNRRLANIPVAEGALSLEDAFGYMQEGARNPLATVHSMGKRNII